MATLEQLVKHYMRGHVQEHLDCGKVNCTALAEDAASEFAAANLDDCFEWAFEVAQEYEAAS